MFGLKPNCRLDVKKRYYCVADYESNAARWCPGCGDHAVLATIQRLCRDEQLAPEKTVFVSGIGCSSRFPHYMKTYGFHGLHGRALPVASGVKMRRPDLKVFTVMGDGDCCSIGTAHWIHAIRYNVDMVAMMFDNEIYGLTKGQTSPTSPVGTASSTHPAGSILPPLNPIAVTLGVGNASFVAQTVDWNPAHMLALFKEAYDHPGFAFIRILQRCPHFVKGMFEEEQTDPDKILLMTHPNGVELDESVARMYPNHVEHDPADLNRGQALAATADRIPIGIFYRNPDAPRYDQYGASNLDKAPAERLAALERDLDSFAV